MLPQFNEMLLKCLPNAENTPAQADLYEAFTAGNVQSVLSVPRWQRKQLFVTNISVDYTDDVETAAFPQTSQAGARRTGLRGGFLGERDRGPGARTSGPMPSPRYPIGDGGMAADQGAKTGGAGFTVLIEGYSPYQPISELLDPLMVGDNRDRWGVVTRFENIEKLFPDMPFILFNKHEITHFKVDTGLVDLINTTANMPAGIGVEKTVERVPQPQATAGAAGAAGVRMTTARGTGDFVYSETVLVDPMTGEEISKTYDIITQDDISANPNWTERDLGKKKWDSFGNEQYIERDRWFRIQAKFTWTDAPAVETSPAAADYGNYGPR